MHPFSPCRVHDLDLWSQSFASSSLSVTKPHKFSSSRHLNDCGKQQDATEDQEKSMLVVGAASDTVDVRPALAIMRQQRAKEVDVLMEDAEDSEIDMCQVQRMVYTVTTCVGPHLNIA